MGTHPIFESDFDCLTEMKLGATVIVAASAQGFGGATTGLPTAMPTVGTRPTRSPEYVYTTPERPRSPQPTMNHQSPHHTGSPQAGSPHQTGSPHSGRPERPEGGCSDRAMMQWRTAMKQWQMQQKEWEYHFNMWKDGNMDDDHHGSGDYDGEWGSGDYDHHNDSFMPGYDDHNDGGIWETIAPFFEYLNSNEFCDMFQLLPEEWDPKHWTGICRANNKLNKELTMLIESLFTGIQREKWSEEMCQSIGYYLKDVFKLSYWPEGLGYVDALYEPCKCTHNIVYDLSMGASPNLPGVMVCGKTWMDSFNYMEMEIPENFTISASAEQLLRFWLDSQEDVMKFKKAPLASLQMWADKWMSSAYKLYEGLKNADMLLAQVKARMAAFGLDNSDFNNLNNTDLINGIYEQNMEIWGNVSESLTEKRLYNFWEDPEGKMPSDEELEAMLGFALEFGFDAQKMMQLAMKPYESSPGPDGTMVNNLVWVYRLYTERMNEIVSNDSAKTFIPVDVFQMLMYHQEELFSAWQAHLASDSALSEENHSFSDHIFATWVQVIADKVKEAEMKPTMSYDK